MVATSCSLLLDFDGSSESVDAGAPDAAQVDPCERFEPNDTIAASAPIDPGTYALGLCEDDDADYFSLELGEGQRLFVEIRFDFELGSRELELRLLEADSGDEVASGIPGALGEASIERSDDLNNSLPAGHYLIEVVPRANLTDRDPELLYELELSH